MSHLKYSPRLTYSLKKPYEVQSRFLINSNQCNFSMIIAAINIY